MRQFAEFIRSHRAAILADWEREVRSQPHVGALARPVLLDHIPQLLSRIAQLIEQAEAGDGAGLPGNASEIHAISRLEVGFDLRQVIHEFTLLRGCILGRWESSGAEERQAGLWLLNGAIDKAIVTSVERYTQAQHSTLEALDRISAAALENGTLDDFLERLLRAVLESMPTVDTAAVLLLEDDMLWVRAAVGLEEEVTTAFGLRVGEGFAGQVAAERQPLLLRAEQVGTRAKSDILRRRGVQALYGVPLLRGRELVGVVHVGSLAAPDFSEQDRFLLGSMASRATAAIVQHALRDAAELHARQQTTIAELAAFGLAADDPQRVMDRALAVIAEVLETDATAIERLESEGMLRTRAQHGDWPLQSPRPVAPGSLAEYTLRAAQSVIVQDFRTEARFDYPAALRERGILVGMTAQVWLAGEQGGRPYGIIGTFGRRRRTFSRQDGMFLQAVGSIVAGALLRRRAAAALRESEERLRLAIEVAQLGTFDWDLTTGDIRWSARTREMFGMHDDMPVSRENRAALIHPDDRARAVGLIEAAMDPANGGAYASEYRVLPADGSPERWISAQGQTLFDDEGRPLRFIGIAKDITMRKHADLEQERLLRELEQAVRFREDILAIVSHDLRSPLAAINLSASLLARQVLAASDARIQKQLETILRASGRMEHLIGDLLDMANIQAGQLSIQRGSCDAAALVGEAREFLAPTAAAKGISLDAQALIENVAVYCDHDRIQQVFSNLLSNAVKFSGSGDTIRLRAEREDGCVRFTVADSGPGIAPEALAHIFEPYWSADGYAKRGTGLGLFITKGIVDAHGGRVWAESTPGEGSAFHFTLPVVGG